METCLALILNNHIISGVNSTHASLLGALHHHIRRTAILYYIYLEMLVSVLHIILEEILIILRIHFYFDDGKLSSKAASNHNAHQLKQIV